MNSESVNKKEKEASIFNRIIFSLFVCAFCAFQIYLAYKQYFLNMTEVMVDLGCLYIVNMSYIIICSIFVKILWWCEISEIIITDPILFAENMILIFIIAFIIEPYIISFFYKKKKIE
jgi:hypothetical protein